MRNMESMMVINSQLIEELEKLKKEANFPPNSPQKENRVRIFNNAINSRKADLKQLEQQLQLTTK